MDELLITRDSSIPANELLAAIANETREWRESAIPPALRAEGVLRVIGTIKGARFDWSLYGGEPRSGSVRLRGEVRTTTSGSVVKARVVRATTTWPAAAVMAGLGALSLIPWNLTGAVPFFVIAAILAFTAWAQSGTLPNWTRSRAEYLVERAHHAVASAEGPALGIASQPANERWT